MSDRDNVGWATSLLDWIVEALLGGLSSQEQQILERLRQQHAKVRPVASALRADCPTTPTEWIRRSSLAEHREQRRRLEEEIRAGRLRLRYRGEVAAFRREWRQIRDGTDGERDRDAANDRHVAARLALPTRALRDLNGDQRLAVVQGEDANLVIAGAGTGKTRTMVAKACDLIQRGSTG